MPTYKFHDTKGGKEWTEFMSISEMEQFLKDNPHIELGINGAPVIGYSTLTRKPDSGFRDVLKEIKKKHRGSNINTW